MNADLEYNSLLRDVLVNGIPSGDRTGTGTLSVFGRQARFSLKDGFPILTTKKIFFKAVVVELLWFIAGDTNVKFLQDNGVTIWDEWSDENGDLGPVYGKQWRRWETGKKGPFVITERAPNGEPCAGHQSEVVIDQLQWVIDEIKRNPNSRRLIVSAWNPAEVDQMALPPCHTMFQFYVRNGTLSCQLYQRSADLFLGVPFNIASYALLTHMVAKECGLEVGEFIHTFGDLHIYNNHVDQVYEQLSRPPWAAPTLILEDAPSIFDYTPSMIKLADYRAHPPIKAQVAV